MMKPPNKRPTQPGIGEAPRIESAELARVQDSFRREETESPAMPPVRRNVRDSVRREDPEDEPPVSAPTSARAKESGPNRAWSAEATTGTRRRDGEPSGRPPVKVDKVGAAAVKLARSGVRESGAPKVIASRAIISQAPIDARAAFVLSLVDGRNTVETLLDVAGMPEDEVRAILERLARLGLISLA